MSSIGIISALPSEARCIAGSPLPLNQPVNIFGNIFIIVCGIGAMRAKDATEQLIKLNATTLISWGTAASLVDELQTGDLIIPEKIISSNELSYLTDTAFNQKIYECLSDTSITIYKQPLSSSSKILNTLQDKADHHEATGAVAVDMESAAIASVAREKKLPFIAIRSIVDEKKQTVPPCVINNIDAFGHVNIPRLLFEILKSPQQATLLYKLAKAMSKACNTLKLVADKIRKPLCS